MADEDTSAQPDPSAEPPEVLAEGELRVRLPERARLRLTFQTNAARVQGGVSVIVAEATGLFRRLYELPIWRADDSRTAAEWIELSHSLTLEWQELQPPEQLEPLWRRLVDLLSGLDRLFEQIPTLEGAQGDALRERVRGLQEAFNAQLELTNAAETELLAHERALRSSEGVDRASGVAGPDVPDRGKPRKGRGHGD